MTKAGALQVLQECGINREPRQHNWKPGGYCVRCMTARQRDHDPQDNYCDPAADVNTKLEVGAAREKSKAKAVRDSHSGELGIAPA